MVPLRYWYELVEKSYSASREGQGRSHFLLWLASIRSEHQCAGTGPAVNAVAEPPSSFPKKNLIKRGSAYDYKCSERKLLSSD